MKMKKIAVLNGPNLDRLGKREPDIYGKSSLADLEKQLVAEAKALGITLDCFQSNYEGALLDKIAHWSDASFNGLIMNPGALTHTSIALRDAVAGTALNAIEVHISNIYTREAFRQHSLTAEVSLGVISGLGLAGYSMALHYLHGMK